MGSAELWEDFDASFEDLRRCVEKVLREMGCTRLEWSHANQVVTGRAPWSWWTMFVEGELLTVAVDPCGEVWVQSEWANKWYRNTGHSDFGRHKSNCRRVLENLRQELTRSKDPKP